MIKINLELPDFDNELSISVTLRKDGEVIKTSSSSPGVVKTEVTGGKKVLPPPSTTNLMDMSF